MGKTTKVVSGKSKVRMVEAKQNRQKTLREVFDAPFQELRKSIQNRVNTILNSNVVLVATKADPEALWAAYLEGVTYDMHADPDKFPVKVLRGEAIQHHVCSCCKAFIKNYGHLAVVDEEGQITPLLWHGQGSTKIPAIYKRSTDKLHEIVRGSKIESLFFSDSSEIGESFKGVDSSGNTWSHFGLMLSQRSSQDQYPRHLSAFQKMSESVSEYQMLKTISTQITVREAEDLISALNLGDVPRTSDLTYVAENLLDFTSNFKRLSKADRVRAERYIWFCVGAKPASVKHFRNTVLGTLYEDLQKMSVQKAGDKLRAKMRPDLYQRPQAQATSGNAKSADDIIKKLGLPMNAFFRRQASYMDDARIRWIWKPKKGKSSSEVAHDEVSFSSAIENMVNETPRGSEVYRSAQTVTFLSLLSKIQSAKNLEKIEVYVSNQASSFAGLLTSKYYKENGLPYEVLKWTGSMPTNDFSWYQYTHGSYPSRWNIKKIGWVEVQGLMVTPDKWESHTTDLESFKDTQYLFALKDCHDTGSEVPMALFPEFMISELRAVRSTIESFSSKNHVEKSKNAIAGLMIGRMENYTFKVKLTTRINGKLVPQIYIVDRKC
jgi:hypothetical protein